MESGSSASIVVNATTAPCGSRSGGRAGRRIWAGRRGTGLDARHCMYLANSFTRTAEPKMRFRCSRPTWLRNNTFSRRIEFIIDAQADVAQCLVDLGRWDEALVLQRENYARAVAFRGVPHHDVLKRGPPLISSLFKFKLWDEMRSLSDQLLPVARRLVGADH